MAQTKDALRNKGVIEAISEFLQEYYEQDIKDLEGQLEESLTIDFEKIESHDETLKNELVKNPESWTYNAKQAVMEFDDDIDVDNPQVLIKGYNEHEPTIRELRDRHLGKLVRVDAIVSKTTGVLPKADVAVFQCDNSHLTEVQQPLDTSLEYPRVCSHEDCQTRAENRFRLLVNPSEKINFQKLELQEPPEDIQGGDTPQSETFTIKGGMAGSVSAGDRVKAVGVYRGADQGDSSVLRTYIKGNNIEVEDQEFDEVDISDEEKKQIEELAKEDDIYERLTNSIAPSLHGLEDEKRAAMYQLFRGIRKTSLKGNEIRGDIHILYVGDPGTGKSQLLRYVSRLAPRGIMTNGKGASAAGLTAAAVRDNEFGGDDNWTLQAGALVLADKGVASVDELDKMDSSDRSAMHEGLEQQTISVAKAGINATLKSRCALMGAANPKEGRWDEYAPIPEQIDLEPALVSRFDLIFAPKDDKDEDEDRKLAEHILSTNRRGQQLEAGQKPSQSSSHVEPDIGPELFRKYVAHARNKCNPTMTEDAKEHLREFFVEIRNKGDDNDAIPVTARKIEGLVRISEAAARIRLSDDVTVEHAKRAVEIVRASLREVGFDEETGKYDIDKIEAGQSSSQRDRKRAVLDTIDNLDDEGENGAPKELVIEKLVDNGEREDRVRNSLNKLQRDGEIMSPGSKDELTRL